MYSVSLEVFVLGIFTPNSVGVCVYTRVDNISLQMYICNYLYRIATTSLSFKKHCFSQSQIRKRGSPSSHSSHTTVCMKLIYSWYRLIVYVSRFQTMRYKAKFVFLVRDYSSLWLRVWYCGYLSKHCSRLHGSLHRRVHGANLRYLRTHCSSPIPFEAFIGAISQFRVVFMF